MTNHPREDAIFSTKVKGTLLTTSGGSMVAALLDFLLRHEEAQRAGQPGLSYEEFLAYLKQHGVELTDFERRYLCRSFDNDGSGHISAATYTRHLSGANQRRMQAILQAWDSLEKDGHGDVPRTALVDIHSRTTAVTSPAFDRTFQQGGACSKLRMSLASSHAAGADLTGEAGDETVGRHEFVAFYAGISQFVGTDEDFVRLVLREWAADARTRPILNETERDWGEEGDQLAADEPLLVKDALAVNLGVSTKAYNYSHMLRAHPFVDPLPPLSRPTIMATTSETTYKAHSTDEQVFSDPLQSRRGQAM